MGNGSGVLTLVGVEVDVKVGVSVGVDGIRVIVAVKVGEGKAIPLQPVNKRAAIKIIAKRWRFMILPLNKNAEAHFTLIRVCEGSING